MEVVEVFTDLYFALSSVISSVYNRIRNYKNIMSYAKIGELEDWYLLYKNEELNRTIHSFNRRVKYVLIDKSLLTRSRNNLHCILLDESCKFLNDLDIHVPELTNDAFSLYIPIYWELKNIY